MNQPHCRRLVWKDGASLAACLAMALALPACHRKDNSAAVQTPPGSSAPQGVPPDITNQSQGRSHSNAGGVAAPDTAATASNSSASNTPLSAAEQSFAASAAESGLYEVAIAKVATEKASNPSVKSMAGTLVTDHSRINDQLMRVAGTRVALPPGVSDARQRKINDLSQASGAEFDRRFIETVGLHDHEADIKLFESAMDTTQDKDLHTFIQATLPTLRHHLSMAQELAKTVGARQP